MQPLQPNTTLLTCSRCLQTLLPRPCACCQVHTGPWPVSYMQPQQEHTASCMQPPEHLNKQAITRTCSRCLQTLLSRLCACCRVHTRPCSASHMRCRHSRNTLPPALHTTTLPPERTNHHSSAVQGVCRHCFRAPAPAAKPIQGPGQQAQCDAAQAEAHCLLLCTQPPEQFNSRQHSLPVQGACIRCFGAPAPAAASTQDPALPPALPWHVAVAGCHLHMTCHCTSAAPADSSMQCGSGQAS
jgi:hypothetical protein